ncbi:MAG TPA: glucoamylase family protein, partial [Acidobacteriota bacterium]|nr:glucoamylase family protein [Acidobacteriota bacterium]
MRNTLSWLGRWKLLDNLRRSLVTPALYLMLLCGWILFPAYALSWSAAAAGIILAPLFIQFISGLLSSAPNVRWIGRVWGLGYDAAWNALKGLLQLSFLANNAWVMCDAIVRTLWRLMRRRKLLEWVPAAQAERARGNNLADYFRSMYGSFILTVLASALVLLLQTRSFPVALPLLFLWFFAPASAYATGHLTPRKEPKIPGDAAPILRSYACDIWRYFDMFANAENHWLPPDNFQEIPAELLAHRTSPTNIAFLLLSNIAAYDFGYIGAVEFSLRTERILETLTKLKTFNGHFFNWYDTRTLEPLEPRYVSTVDSGNLATAFIVLKQFAFHFALNAEKLLEPRPERFQGVRDTLEKYFFTVEKSHPGRQQDLFEKIRRMLASQIRVSVDQAELLDELSSAMKALNLPEEQGTEASYWIDATRRVIASHLEDDATPQDIPRRLLAISREAEAFAQEIDFRFLYNENRGIFSIGFNVSNGQLDPSAYDLFASEARLASFVAIAKNDVPQSHWFRMARTITSYGGRRILSSWSGSMFEYLMPLLVLRNEPNTLLDVTYRRVVDLQRLYGLENNIPWGVSEAAYNFRDLSQNYQYGPFGVPALGLKRGLSADRVVAPYATFLAMMVRPVPALRNLEHLEKMGMRGRFGFYESIDFTPDRLPVGEKQAVVRTFMAHHLGMSLISLDNLLHHNAMQRRFHADPGVEATALLLQEKMPLAVRSMPIHFVDERP